MKFGKQLRGIVECSYPEWKPNFMSYKDLKKRIVSRDDNNAESGSTHADDDENDNRRSNSNSDSSPNSLPDTPYTGNPAPAPPASDAAIPAALRAALSANASFFETLRQEVDKVNDFFLEKQEDFVIEHQHLCARVEQVLQPGAASRTEVNRLRQRLIDFHAQLVILENYSTVNYTGFRKILKKHDKKTGLKLRSTCLRNVTATPFFLSDIARRLLLTTERQMADLDQIRKFRRDDCDTATEMRPLPRMHDVPNPALGLIALSLLERHARGENWQDGGSDADVDAEPEVSDRSNPPSPEAHEQSSGPPTEASSPERRWSEQQREVPDTETDGDIAAAG